MNRIKLNIESLVYSQTQSGAYVLVLIEEDGARKLPIVIGTAEAQAIAIALEGMRPPRPLTHDLFINFASAYNINLVEVLITKLEEGIFYSELVCESFANRIKIDSRTSDAVALAIRFKCPIYANDSVLKMAGISANEFGNASVESEDSNEIDADNKKQEKDFENIPFKSSAPSEHNLSQLEESRIKIFSLISPQLA
ncbi:MAG: bifunctional nuclease family protein, partial [Bacteroidales bacterium]|nr:bifunctional nuclease family protein [Bacteroidales bacterium]